MRLLADVSQNCWRQATLINERARVLPKSRKDVSWNVSDRCRDNRLGISHSKMVIRWDFGLFCMRVKSAFSQRGLRWVTRVGTLLLIAPTIVLAASKALAAETIVFRYGLFGESISVSQLAEFAQTGQASPSLSGYFRLFRQKPNAIRRVLNRDVNVDLLTLDRFLNSSSGERVLDQLGEAIQTPVGEANRQALRAAIVLSAKDNRVSLIEVLQNYPTRQLYIDGRAVGRTYRQVARAAKQIQSLPRDSDLR